MIDLNQKLTQIEQEIKQKEADIDAIEDQLIDEEDIKRKQKLSVKLNRLQQRLKDLQAYRKEVVDAGTRVSGAAVVENPAELVAFWRTLASNTTAIQADAVISLPQRVYILGNPALGSSLYVRRCYPAMLEASLSIIAQPSTPHLVILGNPGIGKTYFGYLLLLHLARNGATVVYESGKAKRRYLFSKNLIAQGDRTAFWQMLDNPDTFYIVDAIRPVDVAAKTILLSSPRRDVWYKYSDDHCDIRYMPVWSKDEIQMCRGLLYQSVSEEDADELFSQWGGVARFVLENAYIDTQQKKLTDAIASVDLDAIIRSIGQSDAPDKAAHRLVHIDVADDFLTTSCRFASDYVADRVYQRLYEDHRQRLMTFIAVSHDVSDIATLRGQLFERHAHHLLSRGGPFQIRSLDNDSDQSQSITLPRLDILVFDESQVQGATNVYFRPRSNNYESVDAFIKPNLLFQMTSAKKHPTKQAGLHRVLNVLGNPPDPCLFFVVPPDRFDSFNHQSYEDASGRVMEQPTFLNVRSIKQYVLCLNLTP